MTVRKICSIAGCGGVHRSSGLCHFHFHRHYKGRDLLSPRVTRRAQSKRGCSIPDCIRPHNAYGYCATHLARLKRHGNVNFVSATRGPYSKGKGKGAIKRDGYRYFSVGNGMAAEHRMVMEMVLGRQLVKGESVHHKNGNKLDNRPENLELWSHSQPSGQRVEDKLLWANEIVALYGSEYGLGGGCE